LTEPNSLAFLRALRRCLRSGLRLASSPASNQPSGRPSWTRFSSSPRLPALRRCLQLSPPALPQISLAADPWDLPSTLIACSCPPALPSARLAPHLQPCLDLVSGSRLLQYFRPEPATSRRLSILWLPSCPGSDSRPSASALRLRPFPWPFGLALSSVSRLLPRASLSGWASAQSFRPSPPLNPPAAFRLRRSTRGSRPSSPAIPSGQPSGLPLSGASALACAPSL